MNDLVEALRIEGNLRVNEKEEIFGNRKSREDRIADDLCYQAASRISQQDAELERLRRELAEARKAAFIEAAEIAETLGVYPELNVFAGGPEWYKHGKAIAKVIRAKAEGQP